MAETRNKHAILLGRREEIPDETARGFVFGSGGDRRESRREVPA
jgi:hypothetical protein